jgi:hypothetical protein
MGDVPYGGGVAEDRPTLRKIARSLPRPSSQQPGMAAYRRAIAISAGEAFCVQGLYLQGFPALSAQSGGDQTLARSGCMETRWAERGGPRHDASIVVSVTFGYPLLPFQRGDRTDIEPNPGIETEILRAAAHHALELVEERQTSAATMLDRSLAVRMGWISA